MIGRASSHPARYAAAAYRSTPPQPKPLRMTVQVGHRVGDVCYARVPSTGQRVAGRVPPGLRVGDKFLVMYMPDPTGGARQSPTEVAMGKARDPSAVLQVEELLDLMHADTWTGDGQPPVRTSGCLSLVPSLRLGDTYLLVRASAG